MTTYGIVQEQDGEFDAWAVTATGLDGQQHYVSRYLSLERAQTMIYETDGTDAAQISAFFENHLKICLCDGSGLGSVTARWAPEGRPISDNALPKPQSNGPSRPSREPLWVDRSHRNVVTYVYIVDRSQRTQCLI
jgi:hypothetical protein